MINKNSNIICAKAADELLTISDITASFVLGYIDDRVCISGRSIGDVNVQIILEKQITKDIKKIYPNMI